MIEVLAIIAVFVILPFLIGCWQFKRDKLDD